MYITYIILTGTIIIFSSYVVTATQLSSFLASYPCDNNFTLKMAAIVMETPDKNLVNKIQCIRESRCALIKGVGSDVHEP
jgi:hypothetical protein